MIFELDNYDSFTYTLVHMLYGLGLEVVVRRNREVTVEEVLAMRPAALVLSPGPGRPERAGILQELIAAAKATTPMLGVCLGHQAIGQVFGAEVVAAGRIMHGKISLIRHDGRGLFQGVRDQFKALRYHSLALKESTLPADLEVTARSEDGEVMGVRHRRYVIEGIQYHPEAVMSANGKSQLANFLQMVDDYQRKGLLTC
jgi:anthranilate synthase/aminodeoxychorismate synthase-like glutamine amidotransferase